MINEYGIEGMTLRDYFAASALTAILQNKDHYNRKACKHAIELGELDSWKECNAYTDADSLSHGAEICATAAYNIADAMMKARKEDA